MAKSKRKSGSSTEISRWEIELAQGCLNEDDWKTIVLFAIPNEISDVKHCNVLTESISTGLRKLFSVIEYDSLIKEVKDLAHGKPGKGKASKPPPFIEIVDSIKSVVDQGEDLPPNLLAKLLKFKMLMIKQKDLDKREDERKAAEAAAKQAKQDERSRSKIGTSSGRKRGKSQSPGRKKGKKDDAAAAPKKDTKLKRRGEVEDTFKTIDDEPDGADDPQHYIIITSVYEPRVLQPLIDLGVAVDGIIKVKSENYMQENEQANAVERDEQDDEENVETLNVIKSDEEDKRNEEKVKEKLLNFWSNIDSIIQGSTSGTKIKEVADLSLVVQDSVIPEGELQEMDQEKKTEYGTKVFEYAANICYNFLDARKRYKRYLDNLKLTHIPSLKETILTCKPTEARQTSTSVSSGYSVASTDAQASIADVDMRYYNHLMDHVPSEAHSVPLLLDSLLRQVEATVDQKDPMNEPKRPREDMLDPSIGEYLDIKLRQLGLKNPEVKSTTVQKKSNEPIILHYGDERTRRIHHLSEFAKIVSPRDAEERIYDCHHIISAIQSSMDDDYVESSEKKSMMTRKQQLAHFCTAFENQAKFDKVLALMSFEVLPLKFVGVDDNVSSPTDDSFPYMQIGWDDPYTINLKDIDDDQNPTDDADKNIKDLKILRNLSGYQYSEYFDSKIFPQVLDQAMITRPYVDMYYHFGLSNLLLVLHNPCGEQLKNCKTWETWLHSNVGLRNYLQYVAEEVSQWQQEEDIKEEIRNMPEAPKTPPREPSPVAIKPDNRNKMMTRAEMLEMKEAEESKQKKKGGKSRSRSRSPAKRPPSNSKSPVDKREKAGSSLKRTGSAKKSSRAGTARKNAKFSQERNVESTESQNEEAIDESKREYPFHGYDVGDDLVHVSGATSYLFPKDGSLIKIESYDYINGSKANQTTVYNGENMLTLNVRNPIIKLDDDVKASVSNEISIQNEMESADTDKDVGRFSELMDLLSSIPSVPELQEPQCEESFMTVNFSDGMRMGMESHTSTKLQKRLDALSAAIEDVRKSVSNLNAPGLSSNAINTKTTSPKGRRNKEEELRRQEELGRLQEKENRLRIQTTIKDVLETRRACLKTSNMFIGCPDGLQLTFVHDEVESEKILNVRQEYTSKGNGNGACDNRRLKLIKEELSRLITLDGAVVKYMVDGSVVVLLPNGSVCTTPSFSSQRKSIPRPHTDTLGLSKLEATSSFKQPENFIAKPNLDSSDDAETPVEWLIVNAEGERYRKRPYSDEIRLNELVISQATCPRTKEDVETREDGVVMVKRPDGTVIVEHVDGTRLTTYFVENSLGQDSETGEEEVRVHDPIQYVKVECVGYATVLINKAQGEVKTIFGNGSEICASTNGGYQIQKPDSTRVLVNQKGETIFAPRGTLPDTAPYEVGNLLPLFDHVEQHGLPSGVFLLKPADANCLSTIDHCGNKFSVSHLGHSSTEIGELSKDASISDENLPPRYFIVHKDCSAEELLREEDYYECLKEAEKDPMVAVLRPPMKSVDGTTAITILKPFEGTNGERWLKQKDEAEIIPVDLRERDFKSMPPRESKTTGPKFGSNAGIGFQVATKPVAKQPKPVMHCPKVLEIRHIAQFNGLNTEERRKMIEGIEKYRLFVNEQIEKEMGLLPSDPRNEEERKTAGQVYERFKELRTESKDLSAYGSKPDFDVAKVADDYLEATKVPPSPPPQKAKPQRSLREWEKDKIDIAELKYAKEYLRSGIVPPYFDTLEGQQFLSAMEEPSDIEKIVADLAKETVHPSYRPVSETSSDTNEIAGEPSNASNQSGEYYDLRKSLRPLEDKSNSADEGVNISSISSPFDTKLNVNRPGNPTPAEAASGDSGLGNHREMQNRSRPFNPTPHQASKSNHRMYDAPVTESINEMAEIQYAGEDLETKDLGYQGEVTMEEANISSIQNQQLQNIEGSPYQFAGLNYTVTGEPRKKEVKIPASIRGSKPGAITNQKFMAVEEPVRRHIKTASVAGTVKPESTSKLRGFHLLPDCIDFGVLKEGMSYSQTVLLKNVGIDICRFRIVQPPPSTGLKVIYNPGPVAAGMSSRLDVEIFAVAVGVEGSSGVGSIGHHVEIITETDAIYLPVVAKILTSYEYENRSDASPLGGPSKNTLLLSNRPSSRDALTRPRKF